MEYKEQLLNNVIRHVFITHRQQQGLTQANLSLISNTTRQFISQVESGKRQPSLLSISNFAAAIDMTLTELFQEVDRIYNLWESHEPATEGIAADINGARNYSKNTRKNK